MITYIIKCYQIILWLMKQIISFFKSNLGIDFNFECLLLTKCIDTFMQILRILLCPVPLPNLLSVVKEFREDILFNCEHRYNENRNNHRESTSSVEIT